MSDETGNIFIEGDYSTAKEASEGYSPFFQVPQIIANYLSVLPSFQLVHDSIYLYDRDDVFSFSLPALCIFIDSMEMPTTDYYWTCKVQVKLYRNKELANRSAEYFTMTNYMQNMIMNISQNQVLQNNAVTAMPYIHTWAYDAESFRMANNQGIVCTFSVKINWQGYQKYIQEVNYSPTGELYDVTTIKSVGVGNGEY